MQSQSSNIQIVVSWNLLRLWMFDIFDWWLFLFSFLLFLGGATSESHNGSRLDVRSRSLVSSQKSMNWWTFSRQFWTKQNNHLDNYLMVTAAGYSCTKIKTASMIISTLFSVRGLFTIPSRRIRFSGKSLFIFVRHFQFTCTLFNSLRFWIPITWIPFKWF